MVTHRFFRSHARPRCATAARMPSCGQGCLRSRAASPGVRPSDLRSHLPPGIFGPALQPRPTPIFTSRNRPRHLQPPCAAPAGLLALGGDVMLFLGAIVLVVPVFKAANQSPVLGYLFAGVVMGQLGLFRDVDDLERLSELGVLFLLFEMGLELSLDKLRSLAKYAFGLGSLQMALTTAAFMAVALPPGEGFMTKLLQVVFHAPPSLAKITTVDEALVIAVALSLSSSAFVLQLLKERNELETKFGQATLGILLFQDIATVPFLVLLPLLEGRGTQLDIMNGAELLMQLGPTALKTLGALGLVLLGGRTFLRRLFEAVASSRSDEAFFALCLLSVTGASLLTQRMGFSDTLGAFVSGVLLSETNFKAQVEADIQPFRGLLLGLFFVTTGASLDVGLLLREWPTVLALLAGLLALKATLITAVGPTVGLTKAESLRTGFALSQGGEFAFVLLALASQLNVLPTELNKLLIIVVVCSMAATPLLTEAGRRVADMVAAADGADLARSSEGFNIEDPVLICGFGDVGQLVANMLDALGTRYVAFDLTVARVQAAQDSGFNVLYGDGTRTKVLHAAGVGTPKAIAVGYTARQRAVSAVEALRIAYPSTPIIARAIDLKHSAELQEAGASYVVCSETEAGLEVGSRLAEELGARQSAVASLVDCLRDSVMKQREAMVEEDMARHSKARRHGNAAVSGSGAPAGLPSSAPSSASNSNSNSNAIELIKFDSSAAKWEGAEAAWAESSGDDGAAGLLANIGVTLLGAMGSSREEEEAAETAAAGRREKPSSYQRTPADATIDVEASSVRDVDRDGEGGGEDAESSSSRVLKSSSGDHDSNGSKGAKKSSTAAAGSRESEAGSVKEGAAAADENAAGKGVVVLVRKNDGQVLALPDGSMECPLDWEEGEEILRENGAKKDDT